MADKIKVTVWNEFQHEQKNEFVKKLYPDGMHAVIAAGLRKQPGFTVRTAVLEEPDHGLTDEVLNDTEVLMWWGHMAHAQVEDRIVDRVQARVLDGMGLVILHSGHNSKIFKRLMGTSCSLCWREAGERERLWVVNPNHPITQGVGRYIELPNTEMYGEFFDIPEPDELIFVSWFEGGEVFRSGAVWHRGKGRVFYFRPGHETYPIFYNQEIIQILANSARWARFSGNTQTNTITSCPQIKEPLETLSEKDFEQGVLEHPEESLKG